MILKLRLLVPLLLIIIICISVRTPVVNSKAINETWKTVVKSERNPDGKVRGNYSHHFVIKLIAKLFDLLNIKGVFEDLKGGRVTGATCYACKLGITVLQHLIEYGKGPEEVGSIAKKLCRTFRIEDESVCDGAVNLFEDEFISVFTKVAVTPSEVCGIVLGESCAKVTNPLHNWTIMFPYIPKPPVAPKVPQKPITKTMKVLHISDTHIDPHYLEGGEVFCGEPLCCRNRTPKADLRSGYWGEYRNCDIPTRTFEQMLKFISVNHPDIDYVLWTGDIPPHDIWRQTKSGQLKLLQYVSSVIDKYLGSKLIIPSLGNHESVPVNSFPPPFITGNESISWLYDELVNVWSNWLPKTTLANIKKGAFYSIKIRPKLKLISLNTNYCNNQNWWLLLNSTDPAGELEWLLYELQSSELLGEKVHIVGHIPPGSSDCFEVWSRNYYKIITRYESTVVAQFFGHTHQDELELFYDSPAGKQFDDLRATNLAYVTPSMTTFGYMNPGYRIYTVDDSPGSSHLILDHETYFLNLTDANNGPKMNITWQLSYSAIRDLALKSMEPQEWHTLVLRMIDDNVLFQKFYSYYYNRSDYVKYLPCDGSCKKDLLCRLVSGRTYNRETCNQFLRSNYVKS